MIKYLKNIFRKKTKEEKLNKHADYLCYCMLCGRIDGKEAIDALKYYKEKLYNE